jgi:hypothetical protein
VLSERERVKWGFVCGWELGLRCGWRCGSYGGYELELGLELEIEIEMELDASWYCVCVSWGWWEGRRAGLGGRRS